MDVEDETRKFKFILFFGLALVVSTFFTWGELMYLLRGGTAEGQVTLAEQRVVARGRGRTSPMFVVKYEFTDAAGNVRDGSDRFDPDSAPAVSPGDAVTVSYRPGPDGDSRLAGHANWFIVVVWIVCFGVTAFFVGGAVRESMAYSREVKARRASEVKKYRY